jgi:hypothetical protein
MSTQETAWEAAQSAASALGPEADLLASADAARLSLSSVTSDTYAVGAINDHIVPWHGSYKTGGLLGGEVRYVLSSGGHIAGIVNQGQAHHLRLPRVPMADPPADLPPREPQTCMCGDTTRRAPLPRPST